jgi:signal transduction histidine kinase
VTSDPHRNEALLRRYIAGIYGEHDFSVIDDVFDEATDFEWERRPEVDSFAAFKQYMRASFEKFEDVDYDVHHVVADDEEGFARWTFTARLVEGFAGIPPTGQRRSTEVVTTGEFADKLTSVSTVYDRRDLLPEVSRLARGGILQHVSDGLVVVDENDVVVDVNKRALSLFDEQRLAVIGKQATVLFDAAAALPPAGETAKRQPADGRRTVEVRADAVENTDGERIGRVFLLRDITERRRRSRQLAVLNRVLRHNLRNALTTIIGQAEHLERADSPSAPQIEHAADRIVDSAEELSDLSEKVQRVEAIFAPDRVERRQQDITDVLAPVTARTAMAFPSVDLEVDVPESLPVVAISPLEFALESVVENACEHNEHPEPRVRVTADGSDDGDRVRLRVADNGPGIPEYERRVLEAGEETPLEHSTGLDLWLVYWVVALSGGELAFEENDPRGTVVTIALPTPGATDVDQRAIEDVRAW